MRRPSEIVELHSRLGEAFPDSAYVARPLPQHSSPKKKRSVLASLSRTLSPRRTGSSAPFRPTNRQPSPNPLTPASLTGLAEALTAYSRHASVREHAAWQKFFAVRREDLRSDRVERRIKRYRSDQTLKVSRSHMSDPFQITSTAIGDLHGEDPEASDSTEAGATTIEFDKSGTSHSVSFVLDAQLAHDVEKLLDAHRETNDHDMPSVSQVDISSQPDAGSANLVHQCDSATANKPTCSIDVFASPEVALQETPVEAGAVDNAQGEAAGDDALPATSTPPAPTSSKADAGKPPSPSHAVDGDAVLTEEAPSIVAVPTSPDCSSSDMARSPSNYSTMTSNTSEMRSRSITLESFEMMRVLGKGCAGKVLLVREKKTGELMALKAITKRHVLAHRELAHTRTEQSVLKACARDAPNPFIVRLHYSFHDKETLYLALDFHPGGDLATQLARWGRLGRDRARFYICEIIEGVESLHRAGIIYRDLKPENVLISATGHCVLTDFGLSKDFGHRPETPGSQATGLPPRPHWLQHSTRSASTPPSTNWLLDNRDTTMSFCGTAEYLAPEVLLGEPYSYEVDVYAAGTMLYEMLAGVTPFYASDHASMYRRVLHDDLSFESAEEEFDPNTRTLLRGMLQRDPLLRITIPRLKRMPYFDLISWDLILTQRYMPPFVPQLDPLNPADLSWFDDAYLSMPAEIKGENPEDEPGGGREAPAGEAQSALDDSGKDVFDGYSYYGREPAPNQEDDVNICETAYSQPMAGAVGQIDVGAGAADMDSTQVADRHSQRKPACDSLYDSDEDVVCTPARQLESPEETPIPPDEQHVTGDTHPESPGDPAFAEEEDPTETPQSEGGEKYAADSISLESRSDAMQNTRADITCDGSPPQQDQDRDGFSSLIEEPEPESESEWINLEPDPIRLSVKNGGREATLWQRGFRDKYKMAVAPLAPPLRPPRPSKVWQDSRAGSSSSAISSLQASPATTPEPPSSPRPFSAIRRLTSTRPLLSSRTLHPHEARPWSRPSVASPKATALPSPAPSGVSSAASSIGEPPRKSSPVKRLARSASGFIDRI